MDLDADARVPRRGVPDFDNFVAGPPDFGAAEPSWTQGRPGRNSRSRRSSSSAASPSPGGFPGPPPPQIALMLFALRVHQVGALVDVQGQAQAALVAAEMVFQEVRVAGEVDGLEGQFAQTLAAVGVALARTQKAAGSSFASFAMLKVHGGRWQVGVECLTPALII